MLLSLIPVIAIDGCKPTGAVATPQQQLAHSNIMAIAAATNAYCLANGEAMPPDLQTIVTAGFLPAAALNSPFGPVSDGGSDYWFSTSRQKISMSQYPSIEILVYDRAMYEDSDFVAVATYDCYSQIMASGEFQQLMKRLDNRGVNFNLP
ncbi:MAG: hypothetical protein IIB53_15475 [Planctomycetes bacterium]|nr:hypothetical protein [Planctomycetota bacterium]